MPCVNTMMGSKIMFLLVIWICVRSSLLNEELWISNGILSLDIGMKYLKLMEETFHAKRMNRNGKMKYNFADLRIRSVLSGLIVPRDFVDTFLGLRRNARPGLCGSRCSTA